MDIASFLQLDFHLLLPLFLVAVAVVNVVLIVVALTVVVVATVVIVAAESEGRKLGSSKTRAS